MITGLSPKFVPPYGNLSAPFWFIGEAPGREEDRLGQTFVGPSGRLLRGVLGKTGYTMVGVRFQNIVPFRPWKQEKNYSQKLDRTPTPDEIETNFRFLLDDLKRGTPKVIVLLGGTALRAFCGTGMSLRQCVGKYIQVPKYVPSERGIKIGVNFHPAYLVYKINNNEGDAQRTLQEYANVMRKYREHALEGVRGNG